MGESRVRSVSSADPSQGLPFTRRRQFTAPSSTRMQAFLRRTRHKLGHFLRAVNQFMTVPMWSACVSILVAMIPPLQARLVQTKPLTQAITSAGQCSSRLWALFTCPLLTPLSSPHIGRSGRLFLHTSASRNRENRRAAHDSRSEAQILRRTRQSQSRVVQTRRTSATRPGVQVEAG
jgi:hypothetical protein